MMKDFYNLFVELSLQQCTKNEYANHQKVKMHNAASRKLRQLQAEMQQHDSEEILCRLLHHEDNRVKIHAASLCLQMNVLVSQAVPTLKNIIDSSDDATICFSAQMLLQSVKHS